MWDLTAPRAEMKVRWSLGRFGSHIQFPVVVERQEIYLMLQTYLWQTRPRLTISLGMIRGNRWVCLAVSSVLIGTWLNIEALCAFGGTAPAARFFSRALELENVIDTNTSMTNSLYCSF